MRLGRLTVVVVAVVALASVYAPGAFAQNSSLGGYLGNGGATQANLSSGGGGSNGSEPAAQTASANTSSGSLPFTGLDIGLAIGGGLLLLGAGAAITVLGPRREAQGHRN